MKEIQEWNLIEHNHRLRQMGFRPKPYRSSPLKKFRIEKPVSGAVINFNVQTSKAELMAIYAIHKFAHNWTGGILVEPSQELIRQFVLATFFYKDEVAVNFDQLLINELPAEFSKYLETSNTKCIDEEQLIDLNVFGINLHYGTYSVFSRKIDEFLPYLKKAKRVIRFKYNPSVKLWKSWWKDIYLDESKQEAWYKQHEEEHREADTKLQPIFQKLSEYSDKELFEHLENYIKQVIPPIPDQFKEDIVSEIEDKLFAKFDLSAAPLVLNRYIIKLVNSLINKYSGVAEIADKEVFTIKEVSNYFRVKEQRIYELLRAGMIKPFKSERVIKNKKESYRYELNQDNLKEINDYFKAREIRRDLYEVILERKNCTLRNARILVKKQLDNGMTLKQIAADILSE